MLTLTNPSSSTYDFSNLITDYQFNVSPSFEWVETLSGKITKKRDLGLPSDRYSCTIDVIIPYTELNIFKTWYLNNRGVQQTISTDLDLFFPNVYSYGGAIPRGLTFLNYFGDYSSKLHVFQLTLELVGSFSYAALSSIPAIFTKGIWTSQYSFAESFQGSITSNNYELITSENDNNNWSVDFEFLTKSQANDLLRFLLTTRTTKTTINRPAFLGGYTRDVYFKSFMFQNQGTYYTGTIDLVEATNYYIDY